MFIRLTLIDGSLKTVLTSSLLCSQSYAEEIFFQRMHMPDFKFFGTSIRTTIDFWPYTMIFKMYYMPICPPMRACGQANMFSPIPYKTSDISHKLQ